MMTTENNLQFFNTEGFYIIPQAIDPTLADSIKVELQHVHQDQHKIGVSRRHLVIANADSTLDLKFRFKDLYVNSGIIRQAIFSDKIMDTLLAFNNSPILAFQNLGFIRGSGLRIHRDSNYVAMQELNESFYACWIALEDVEEGAGELIFYPRSHLLPPYYFTENSTHWVVSRDGIYANEDCHNWLNQQMSDHNIAPQKFIAKKGDCIIWHSDLVHAGAPILKPDSTRYSLLTHFCRLSSRPRYLQDTDNAQLVRVNKYYYLSSAHYNLVNVQTATQLEQSSIHPRIVSDPNI